MKYILIILTGVLILSGCKSFSEIRTEKDKGLNGSFEYVKDKLPVNWYFYTRNTVEQGDFDILTDQSQYKDGQQSVKFVVRSCSGQGGRYSPGLFTSLDVQPGEVYKISFWVKNMGCIFRESYGATTAKGGDAREPNTYRQNIPDWTQFSSSYKIPENMYNLRWELTILSPGLLWLDDVSIEKEN